MGRNRDHGRATMLFLVLALAGFGCASGESRPAAEPDAIRILVYNIHAGRDADGADNLARVAELITSTDADLALLQEVDRGTRRSRGVDQLAELERLTGRHGAFGKTLDYQGGDYGIAVLSRWAIRSDTLIPLPVDPPQRRAEGSYEPRGVQRVVVDGPGGRLVALNTHLDASAEDAYRRQEVVAVLGAAEHGRGGARLAVVGGDFNAEPDSPTIAAMLEAGWMDAWETCGAAPVADGRPASAAGLTYPADAPVKRIDYLFLSPGSMCESATVLRSEASDHRAILVTLNPNP